MQRVLIAGGTGAIGERLVAALVAQGDTVTVLSRRALRPARWSRAVKLATWDGRTSAGWGHLVAENEVIINLAGAGVADSPWTQARKALIMSSRVQATAAIATAIAEAKTKPRLVIQASAIGYYGMSESATMTESSPPGDDFLGQVCQAWEAGIEPVTALGIRTVIIRTGVVFDPLGGAWPKLLLPFKFFVGGPLGSGQQWVSWIHHADEVGAILFLMKQESLQGAFNLTAPNPLRNGDMAKLIGQAMNRPASMPAPAIAMKTILGEMSEVILNGQKVVPERLLAADYSFKYRELGHALPDLLK